MVYLLWWSTFLTLFYTGMAFLFNFYQIWCYFLILRKGEHVKTQSICCSWLSHRLPFYFSFKLAFLVWLMLPQTQGAKFIYDSFLKVGFLEPFFPEYFPTRINSWLGGVLCGSQSVNVFFNGPWRRVGEKCT